MLPCSLHRLLAASSRADPSGEEDQGASGLPLSGSERPPSPSPSANARQPRPRALLPPLAPVRRRGEHCDEAIVGRSRGARRTSRALRWGQGAPLLPCLSGTLPPPHPSSRRRPRAPSLVRLGSILPVRGAPLLPLCQPSPPSECARLLRSRAEQLLRT